MFLMRNFILRLLFTSMAVLCYSFCNAQNFEWLTTTSTSNGNEFPYSNCTDSFGNIYSTGAFSSTFSIGSTSLVSSGGNDVYIAKFNSAGSLLWLKRAGGPTADAGLRIVTDSRYIYVLGSYTDSLTIDTYKIHTSLPNSCFVAKLDLNGNALWIKKIGGYSGNTGLCLDKSGNIYAIERLSLSTTINTVRDGNVSYTSAGVGDVLLSKIDSSGRIIWSKQISGINQEFINDIVFVEDYKLYMVGMSSSPSITAGSLTVTNNINSLTDLLILKADTSGNFYYGKFYGSSVGDVFRSLNVVDSNLFYAVGLTNGTLTLDTITIVGGSSGYMFVACFENNKAKWVAKAGGGSGAIMQPYRSTLYKNDFLYITGGFASTVNFGNIQITSAGATDLFITKLDANGNFLWAKRGGGPGQEEAWGINTDTLGNCYVNGYFSGQLVFSPFNATSTFNQDFFLTKISDIGISRTPLTKTVYCAGDSVYVPYTKYNTFHAANTFYAQLSDTAGNFNNPVTIGSKPSNQNGTIACKLPAGLLYSNKYQLRVVSDSPVVQSYYLNQTYTIYPRPVATANNITLCSGQADTLTAINLKNNTAQWSPVTYLTNINDSSTLFTAPSNTTTTNQVAFVQLLFSNAGGCKDSTTLSVTIRPQLLVTTSTDTTLCSGQTPTITLRTTATGGDSSNYRYLWKDAAGNILSIQSAQDTLQVVTDSTRTYTVHLTDGCTILPDTANSAQVTVTIRPPLQLSIQPDTIVCKGSSVNLTTQATGGKGTGFYTIEWFTLPDTTSVQHTGNTYTVTVNNNQQYQAKLTDGCTALPVWSNSITVNTYNKIQLTPRADTTINKGQSVYLTAQATGGRGSAYTFTWYKLPDTTTAIATTTSLTWHTEQTDSTTTYRVIATDGCAANTDTAQVVITVRQQLEISILSADNDTTICNGQSVTYTLLANYPSAGQQFIWNNGLGTGSTKTLTPITNTTYRVILSDNQSTPDTVYITVNVRAPLQLHNLHDTTICEGQSVTFNPFATGGLASNYQFLWNDNSNTSSKPFSITTTAINATLTVSDNCSSPQSKSITITPELNPKVSLTATPTQGCPPLNTTITNTQNNSGTYTQDWDFADGSNTQTTTSNNNNNSINHNYTITGVYQPTLTLTSSRGCKSSAVLATPITLFEKPEAKFTLSRDTTWVTLPQIQLTNQSSKADSFFWHFSRLINDTITTKTSNTTFHRNFTDSGIYTISLTAKNSACADSTQQKLVVLMDYDVWIPNAFSPGTKDNLNPTFAPVGVGISRYKMIIYNRWGQIVFESKGTQDSWNGCLDNNPDKPLPEGVYVWYIEIFNYHNSGNIKGGMVHLIR